MSEIQVFPEPKEVLPSAGMKGLQGRMEMVGSGQDILNISNKTVTVTKENAGKHEGEFQKILSSASTNERRKFWKARGGNYTEQLNMWKLSLVKEVESRKEYFAKPEQIDFFKSLGIDTSSGFDDTHADAIYKKYFSAGKTASQTDVFTQAILFQITTPDGKYDAEKLASHTEGIKFMAAIFGKDAKNIIMQKLTSAVELKNNPDTFVEEAQKAVNIIPTDSYEEHLVVYLQEAQEKYKEKEKINKMTTLPQKKKESTPSTTKIDATISSTKTPPTPSSNILPSSSDRIVEPLKKQSKEDNIKIFESVDLLYAKLYQHVLTDNPELDQLGIEIATKEQYPKLEYTGGFWRRPDLNNPNSRIVIEASGTKHYESLLQEREISARAAAEMLGINFSILQQHPDILAMFVFVHELGHAKDFIINYLNNPNVVNAVAANRGKKITEMNSLPVPGKSPVEIKKMANSGELEKYYMKYLFHYREKGVFSSEELLKIQEESYRNLPSESYADRFATQTLRKHWVDLGFDKYGSLRKVE